MPHVVIKMKLGRSDAVKERLAKRLTDAIVSAIEVPEKAVSIAIEEVPGDDWMIDVYEPEIAGKAETLVKKPGYGPLAR